MYRFAYPNKVVSDPAKFELDVPRDAEYRVSLWSPGEPGYNTSVPVGVKSEHPVQDVRSTDTSAHYASGGYAWSFVDQSKLPVGYPERATGAFSEIGVYELDKGQAEVLVSRWTGARGIIVADSLRIERIG